MSKFKRMNKMVKGYDEGSNPQDPTDISVDNKLSPDDFTQPGQMIPKDAGPLDFIKYNTAHFNPNDTKNMEGMMMGSGTVGGLGEDLAAGAGAKVMDAADDVAGALGIGKDKPQISAQDADQQAKQDALSKILAAIKNGFASNAGNGR